MSYEVEERMKRVAGVFYAVVAGAVVVAVSFLVYDCNVKTAQYESAAEAKRPVQSVADLRCQCTSTGEAK